MERIFFKKSPKNPTVLICSLTDLPNRTDPSQALQGSQSCSHEHQRPSVNILYWGSQAQESLRHQSLYTTQPASLVSIANKSSRQ